MGWVNGASELVMSKRAKSNDPGMNRHLRGAAPFGPVDPSGMQKTQLGLGGFFGRSSGGGGGPVVDDLFRVAVASADDFAFRVFVLRDDIQGVALHAFCVELLGDFIFQLFTGLCRLRWRLCLRLCLCVSGDGNKK